MTDKPSAPLIIQPDDISRLHRLRDFAAKRPVNIQELMISIKTEDGEREHRKRMTAQTVVMAHGPWDFFVTFSIETGQPAGVCRHMSMSIKRDDRVPSVAAVLLIAEQMGFVGGLEACRVWLEDLSDGGKAVNIVQPVALQSATTAQ